MEYTINGLTAERRQGLPVLTVSPDETYAFAVQVENGWYQHNVRMSDAFADRTDNTGQAICRQYLVKSAESLARLQQWAADPTVYDFSDVLEVV